MKKILIMGLPGSGKTTLAEQLVTRLKEEGKTVTWLNADKIREEFNDWDFSESGRIRQGIRMSDLADSSTTDFVILDFVAPLPEVREKVNADYLIWMDTIDVSRFEDTNKVFIPPINYDFRVGVFDAKKVSDLITKRILNNIEYPVFDNKKETVQMLGRWQPWHGGHRALFERAIKKTGQVCIMIRDCQGWNQSNPFDVNTVINNINRNLELEYKGQYTIMVVPNIVNITYGRDVGYKIEQEVFDDAIHSISATKIRKEMGLK